MKPRLFLRNDFEKLIKILEELTSEKVASYEISSEYKLVSIMSDKESSDINLHFIKGHSIKTMFENTPLNDICKWILYIEILGMLDLETCQFIGKVFSMTDKGRKELNHHRLEAA